MKKTNKGYKYKKRQQRYTPDPRGVARYMQDQMYEVVKKKYTLTKPIIIPAGFDNVTATVSHFGGSVLGGQSAGQSFDKTISLVNANPDGQLTNDLLLYQFMRITGIAIKLIFPEGTDVSSTPTTWAMAYSPNYIIDPMVSISAVEPLASFNTASCSADRPVTRFYSTTKSLWDLGIQWCNTTEFWYNNSKPTSYLSAPIITSASGYNGQLPRGSGASTWLYASRAPQDPGILTSSQVGVLEISYYVQYKGPKADKSIQKVASSNF